MAKRHTISDLEEQVMYLNTKRMHAGEMPWAAPAFCSLSSLLLLISQIQSLPFILANKHICGWISLLMFIRAPILLHKSLGLIFNVT